MNTTDQIVKFFFADTVYPGHGGGSGSSLPSVALVESNGGWALYSYKVCIARRWDGDNGARTFWFNTLKYTPTTSKVQGKLRASVFRHNTDSESLVAWRVIEHHEDPGNIGNALVLHDLLLQGKTVASHEYAEGFGPARGKNKVATTYGELVQHKPQPIFGGGK